MRYLQRCDDDKLRLLAPALAAYLNQRDRGIDPLFAEMCRTQSADNEVPWVRGMFAYLASGGSWRDLVDESGIDLRSRLAVALRFMPDHELNPYVQELVKESNKTADLEAVVLLGLREEGVQLVARYLDRTADVQTAALACAFVHPSLPHSTESQQVITRVIDSYRDLLDRLSLYHARAMFDSEHARITRRSLDLIRSSASQTEVQRLEQACGQYSRPQLQLKCTFCSETIALPGSRDQLGTQVCRPISSSAPD